LNTDLDHLTLQFEKAGSSLAPIYRRPAGYLDLIETFLS